MMGWSKIKNLLCIACNKKFDTHSRKDMGRCMLRIQGSYIAMIKEEAEKKQMESVKDENELLKL